MALIKFVDLLPGLRHFCLSRVFFPNLTTLLELRRAKIGALVYYGSGRLVTKGKALESALEQAQHERGIASIL